MNTVWRGNTYTANQPLFLGGQIYMWNRYINVGHLVWMPDAQYTHGGHHNRVEILNQDAAKQWLTLPLKHTGERREIRHCMPDNPAKNLDKIQKTIQTCYGKYEWYQKLQLSFLAMLEHMRRLTQDEAGLAQLNLVSYYWVAKWLDIMPKPHTTLELTPSRSPDPAEWVAQMGAAINCKLYLGGGVAASAYLKREPFAARNLHFESQNYTMAPYERRYGKINADATVSILDPLFVLGPTKTRWLLDVPAL